VSRFYGTVDGQARTPASRRGSASSGITTYAAGWSGAIRVKVFPGANGEDRYIVSLVPWQSSGGSSRILSEGVLDANPWPGSPERDSAVDVNDPERGVLAFLSAQDAHAQGLAQPEGSEERTLARQHEQDVADRLDETIQRANTRALQDEARATWGERPA
jgi:hypothetical protein